jgi:Leucine-rich repeat (LRR) protein
MENNLLSRFPEAVLGRVAKTLVHLDLSGNDISSVNSIQVEALTQLRWLSLARNRIVVIADETFDSLSGLLHLDISGNALAKVTVRWFEEIKTSLLHLHLSNISLESLPDFDNFSNLLTFNSSDNQLTYLPTNFGVNVSTLRVLDISNNLIPAFPFTLWHTIPRLTQLIMNLNPIRVLSNDSFILMEHLHELDVSELPLEVVQVN